MQVDHSAVLARETNPHLAYLNQISNPRNVQVGSQGAVPFYTPSGTRRGYHWPGMMPLMANGIHQASNYPVMPSMTMRSANAGNSRWSAQRVRQLIAQTQLARAVNAASLTFGQPNNTAGGSNG